MQDRAMGPARARAEVAANGVGGAEAPAARSPTAPAETPATAKLSRRELLARAGRMAAAVAMPWAGHTPPAPGATVGQEAFPRKADFDISDGVTYLNGAYMHPMPRVVRRAVRDYRRFSPSVYNDMADIELALEALS